MIIRRLEAADWDKLTEFLQENVGADAYPPAPEISTVMASVDEEDNILSVCGASIAVHVGPVVGPAEVAEQKVLMDTVLNALSDVGLGGSSFISLFANDPDPDLTDYVGLSPLPINVYTGTV